MGCLYEDASTNKDQHRHFLACGETETTCVFSRATFLCPLAKSQEAGPADIVNLVA